MAGVILQRDFYEKSKRALSKEPNPMEDYVKNFSDAADVINISSEAGGANQMLGFANAIKFKMHTNVAKDNTGSAIKNMMNGIKKKRELREQGITDEEQKPVRTSD